MRIVPPLSIYRGEKGGLTGGNMGAVIEDSKTSFCRLF